MFILCILNINEIFQIKIEKNYSMYVTLFTLWTESNSTFIDFLNLNTEIIFNKVKVARLL